MPENPYKPPEVEGKRSWPLLTLAGCLLMAAGALAMVLGRMYVEASLDLPADEYNKRIPLFESLRWGAIGLFLSGAMCLIASAIKGRR